MNTLDFAKEIRKLSLEMVYKGKASHIGGALSMADILAVLYNEILTLDANNPKWEARDRFLLSKGHACVSLYAALALKGFFPIEDIDTYAQPNSHFLCHASHFVPGVEISAGSLGHIPAVACGLALASKKKLKSWKTYFLVGDGEMDEGSVWESIMFAAHHKLDNLVMIIDYNKIQAMGNCSDILGLDSLKNKLDSFGWNSIEIDGNNILEIQRAFQLCNASSGKPHVIIANTIKGKGVSFMENQLAWHYKSPNQEQYEEAIKQIMG